MCINNAPPRGRAEVQGPRFPAAEGTGRQLPSRSERSWLRGSCPWVGRAGRRGPQGGREGGHGVAGWRASWCGVPPSRAAGLQIQDRVGRGREPHVVSAQMALKALRLQTGQDRGTSTGWRKTVPPEAKPQSVSRRRKKANARGDLGHGPVAERRHLLSGGAGPAGEGRRCEGGRWALCTPKGL